MSMSSLGGAAMVTVRLSDVPRELRVKVADHIIEKGKLKGIPAASLMLAAYHPIEDPKLAVPTEKADRVLREGKQPPGESVKVWEW